MGERAELPTEKRILDLLDLLDRPISFHRCYVAVTGSINGALMLSQAVYWRKRTSAENGSFYKTRDEWEDETGLTHEQQESARAGLRKSGFWSEQYDRITHRMYYTVDIDKLREKLKEIPVSGNRKGRRGVTVKDGEGSPGSTVSSNRAETTTETTTEKDASLRMKREEVKEQWNLLPDLPHIRHISEGRTRTLNSRLKDRWWEENWREAIRLIPSSSFLMGRVPGRNGGKPFKADFDFFIQPDTVAKILERKYHGEQPSLPSTGETPKRTYSAADHMRAMGLEE